MGGLDDDDLVAPNAGVPVGYAAGGLGVEPQAGITPVEHGEIVADPVHLPEAMSVSDHVGLYGDISRRHK